MPIKITPKIKAIKEYFKKLDGDMQRNFLATVTDITVDNVRERIKPHTKSGRLERNLNSEMHPQKLQSLIYIANRGMLVKWRGKSINYGIFVHFPTKPHIIAPKKRKDKKMQRKALRWTGEDGRFRFAKRVRHPGYKGDPFLYKGLADTFKKIDEIFYKTIKEF